MSITFIFSQYSFGQGIANYYVGFVGRELDAVYDPAIEKMTLKVNQGRIFDLHLHL